MPRLIETARLHVADIQNKIRRQGKLVEKLRAENLPSEDARDVLRLLHVGLDLAIDDLRRQEQEAWHQADCRHG